jgi:hypothetical protein
MEIPLVLLIDIDGTLVGDISPQVCEFELLQSVYPAGLRGFKTRLTTHLQHTSLLRPGFKDFFRIARSRNIEIFLYTASESKWATTMLVPALEAALSIKINRPIFTRNHCKLVNSEYRKPTNAILKTIFNTLRKRYPSLKSVQDLSSKVALIDNNTVLLQDATFSVGMVLCPTYSYIWYYDLLANIPEDVLFKKAYSIHSKLVQYKQIDNIPVQDGMSMRKLYFKSLARNVTKTHESNDSMWKMLAKLIKRYAFERFSTRVLDYFNKKIHEQ